MQWHLSMADTGFANRQTARRDAATAPPDPLAGHRRAQALGQACTAWVARGLNEGVTEFEAADRLDKYLKVHGADGRFPRALAWFGDRACPRGSRRRADWQPGTRRLRAGDTVILDVAPVLHGYAGDIVHTISLGPCAELDRAQAFLRDLRAWLPALFASDLPLADLWAAVDRRIRRAGYENCHARYPQGALGHRISRPGHTRPDPWRRLRARLGIVPGGADPDVLGPGCTANRPGLWAVAPHIGWEGGGAKFKELLVVGCGRARWLDGDLPLLRTGA